MSVFRGIATGFLGAAIEDKAAKDKAHLDVVKSVRANYFNNTLPQTIEMEDNRKNNYDRIKGKYGVNAAELADINKIIDGTGNGFDNFEQLLKTNNLKKEDLEAATFDSDYMTRYNQRGVDFNKKYKQIFDQLGVKEIGGLGPYTVQSQLEESKVDDPIVPPQQPGMEQQTPPPATEFSSTDIRDYLTPIDDFYLKSEYRQREGDVFEQALTSSGLNLKISRRDDGSVSVPEIDEASQNKFNFVSVIANTSYAKNPKRVDYRTIGTESGAYVKAVESLAVRSRANNTSVFTQLGVGTKQSDALSNNKTVTMSNGDLVTPYEAWERNNRELLKVYVKNGIEGRRFIKEKYAALRPVSPETPGYYHFFKLLDAELEKSQEE
tara:strand:+ start:855 stop:1991 length:1137 start_codon:yes stop_codon:yes gene_type:complete